MLISRTAAAGWWRSAHAIIALVSVLVISVLAIAGAFAPGATAAGPKAQPVQAKAPPVGAKAQSAQTEITTKARQAILMDADSGAVLFQHNADEMVPPASMSKLMTMAVVFKALKSGQVKLDDEMLVSVNAWRRGGGPSGTSAMLVPVNTRESSNCSCRAPSFNRAMMPASPSPKAWLAPRMRSPA